MNEARFPRPLELPMELADLILQAASETAHDLRRRRQAPRRVRRGETLRPGEETPMWNELRQIVRFHVRKHGEKVLLARHLGLPKQRIYDFLRAGAAMPDAERTLQLLAWLAGRAGRTQPARDRTGGSS